ncbi:MAG TPA: ELWxxDGT repeat protein [Thermoanaerobaculia bacterium]|jgi:ELWxxDGT repeat protein|nr:ELWxxDGT repeat protein [Thermoanaerobaculia bacterium]
MIRRAAFCSTATALLAVFATSAFAATPASLVRDVRRQQGPNLSSNPSGMVSLGGLALFWARTPRLGVELYQTDGTAEGTSLVADLCPGPCSSDSSEDPIAIGERAFFLASDGARGTELWQSDGTVAGTRSLIDLAPGPADGIYLSLRDGGDRVLFLTFGPDLQGWDLWSSDGTRAGSALFARLSGESGGGVSVPEGAGSPRPMPGGLKFYFDNFTSDGVDELWESDGTAAGTRRVLALRRDAGESICSDDSDDRRRVVAGDFYFAAATAATGCELWRVSDGVAAPFADLVPGGEDSSPHSFVRQGARTLFVANLPGAPDSLWTTDGTPAGTLPAAAAGSPAGTRPVYLGSNSAGAYFAAETPDQGRELWFTAGPPGEYRLLADFVAGAGSSDPERAGVVGDRVYFWTSRPDRGIELNAAVPGHVGSVAQVRERVFGSLAGAGERAVFGADLGHGVGVELAATGGSPESTVLLRDLAQGDPSSYPRQLTRVAGRLLFTATDDAHGQEVWRSDGTTAGTELVADLTPGRDPADFPLLLAPTASGVVLEAPDGSIRHAPARRGGINLLFRLASEVRGSQRGFRLGGRALFFAPVGDAENPRFELWRADGRPEGSRRLAEIAQFDRFFGYGILSAVDPERHRAFFIPSGFDVQAGSFPLGLWVTDGSAAGTRHALPSSCAFCTGAIREAIIGPGGLLLLTAEDRGEDVSRLWATDGTSAGTEKLAESPNLNDGDPIRSLARLGELLLFAASDPEHGQELWVSDGTPAGTRLLADLRPGAAPSWPDGITVVGDRAFFSADDGSTGRELWATDGTEEGTYRVADIRRGTRSSVPQALTAIGNRLVFAADDGKHGLEVWSSDGTTAGTRLASDVQGGRLPSSPSDFLALGSDLLFVASRVATGSELFRLPLSALGAP